jgi:hypothetical protein
VRDVKKNFERYTGRMANVATYDDANLILRLYELRREEKLRQAREWFMQSFKATTLDECVALCPPGSEANTFFRMVTSYWDMVASFVVSGVLNQDLFLQSGNELLFTWTRVKDLAPAFRTLFSNPNMMANMETVANAAIARMNRADPNAYKTFQERVVGGTAAAQRSAQAQSS